MTTAAVTVRPAHAEDAPQLGVVHVRVWRETYRGQMPDSFLDGLDAERSSTMWRQIIARAEDPASALCILVAESEGNIVGFASSGSPRDDSPVRPLELHALNVVASQYGTGVAKRLLDASIGDEPAYLWVAEGNARARRFYEKNGFRLDAGIKDDERLAIRERRMVR